MNIEYMKMLRDYPAQFPKDKYPNEDLEFRNRPINYPNDPMAGILALENEFWSGRPLPKAIREFLYLAGDFCYVRKTNRGDIKKENEIVREDLIAASLSLGRPFFVFETMASCTLFCYTDEGDNPDVHILNLRLEEENPDVWSLNPEPNDITFTGLIEHRIKGELESRRMGI